MWQKRIEGDERNKVEVRVQKLKKLGSFLKVSIVGLVRE